MNRTTCVRVVVISLMVLILGGASFIVAENRSDMPSYAPTVFLH